MKTNQELKHYFYIQVFDSDIESWVEASQEHGLDVPNPFGCRQDAAEEALRLKRRCAYPLKTPLVEVIEP